MTRFLKEIGIFFGSFIMVCLVLFGIQTWNIRKHANFKFRKEYKYLQLGHSHAEAAYNDTLIADFKNLATSGESYFYSYHKLKKILEQNGDIEVVLIEFTNNQMNSNMDNWIWGDKYISKFYPKYGSFLDFHANSLLIKHNLSSLLNNFSVLQKRNFKMLLNNNYDFIQHIGGYVYYRESNLEKDIIFQENNEEINKKGSRDISDTNILYLEKIVKLCRTYGKEIIFIRSPQHSRLNLKVSETSFLQIYNKKFREVPFLDFNDFEIPDYGFLDLEHLNYIGAEVISKTLDSLLKQGISLDYSMENNKRMIVSQ